MRYYVIAGERSGDLHGGNLVKAIKKLDQNASFKGFGGDYMKNEGVALTIHYRDLAFMGFAEVVANMNKIFKNIRICKEDILTFKPDVVILVDYGGFNTRIAKFCKKQNLKVFFYITPKVWAWYQKRALTLKNNVDRMFVILPFEKDFYKKFNWEVDYVGNPVLDAVKAHKPDPDFLQRNNFKDGKQIVALLPGSRKQELLNMIPIITSIAKRFIEFQFAVATVSNLDKDLYAPLKDLDNVRLIEDDTYNLLVNSKAAVVTSGTATLETALLNVPQVVIYKTSTISYKIAKGFIQVPFISLVNLIAGKKVVKELIQQEMNQEMIAKELKLLLLDDGYRKQIHDEYAKIYKTLDIGSASENAARLMVKYLSEAQTPQAITT
jgi:lipid-A-disaccharide synthase